MGCACNTRGSTVLRPGRTATAVAVATVNAAAKAIIPKTPPPIKVEKKGVRVARDVDKYRG